MTPRQAIAHYTITSKLGEGGMGTVYRATDTKLNREVAIKVLPDTFAADPDRLARFTREAQVLASLNHPNIASIYGVEDRALVMELVEGEPLKGPLPWETALDCARQIADALDYAHDKGVVHRDLKPANILITPDRTIKLLDFGLAKAMSFDPVSSEPATSPTLTFSPTTAGFILGTVGYMSPEQATGKAVDRRADIWAFGVVLWELLTGRRLFEGETASEAIAQVLTKEPDWTLVPAPARRLLRSCLQKDPKTRLKSIGDWRLGLDEARDGADWAGSHEPSGMGDCCRGHAARRCGRKLGMAASRGSRQHRRLPARRFAAGRGIDLSEGPRRVPGDLTGWPHTGVHNPRQRRPAHPRPAARFAGVPSARRNGTGGRAFLVS